MKKWINNLSFALWMTALLATGTASARTLNAAASATSVAAVASLPNSLESRRDAAQDMTQGQRVRLDADGKLLPSQGTSALAAGNDHHKPQVLAFLTPCANGTGQ